MENKDKFKKKSPGINPGGETKKWNFMWLLGPECLVDKWSMEIAQPLPITGDSVNLKLPTRNKATSFIIWGLKKTDILKKS